TGPKREARRVGKTIQKIQIQLRNKIRRYVDEEIFGGPARDKPPKGAPIPVLQGAYQGEVERERLPRYDGVRLTIKRDGCGAVGESATPIAGKTENVACGSHGGDESVVPAAIHGLSWTQSRKVRRGRVPREIHVVRAVESHCHCRVEAAAAQVRAKDNPVAGGVQFGQERIVIVGKLALDRA